MNQNPPLLTFRDWRVLLAGAAAVFFTVVAAAVQAGWMDGFDRWVLSSLRAEAIEQVQGGSHWMVETMRDITSLASVALIILVAVLTLAYLLLRRAWQTSIIMIILLAATQTTVTVLKQCFARPRPDLITHGDHVFTLSFPSGHASMAAAVYLTLGWVGMRLHDQRRMVVFFWLTSVLFLGLVGFSRIYLGVHWTSDVLAGWSVGVFWACLCSLLNQWLDQRKLQRTGHHASTI